MSEHDEQADPTQDTGNSTPSPVKPTASVSSGESLAQDRPLAIARCVGLVILVTTTFFAIHWGLSSSRMQADLDVLKATHSIEAPLDLTTAGDTVIPLNHTYDSLHGLAIRLMDLPEGGDPEVVHGYFKDFDGQLVIRDAQGAVVEFVNMDYDSVFVSAENGIHLAHLRSFPTGEYIVTVSVTSPASTQLGDQQVIYCEYMFCHIELLPAMIARAFAIGSGIIALIASLCAIPGLIRFGIWKAIPTGP